MLGELFATVLRWFTRKEKSSVAFEGFDLLTEGQREFNEQVLKQLNRQNTRLDECDEDRSVLKNKVADLDYRVQRCEVERKELQEQLNRHSVELKEAIGISNSPQLPLRTTRDHTPE